VISAIKELGINEYTQVFKCARLFPK